MYFEKVSLDQWIKDLPLQISLTIAEKWHKELKLPKRATQYSAGYDFFMPYGIQLLPQSKILIPTGIRWVTDINNKNKVLSIYPRSGLGFKHGIKLSNTVGIIDADYYQSKNEGHIMIKLVNPSDEIVPLAKTSGFVQGIITPYETVLDDHTTGIRDGGFGSTDRS